MDFLSIGILGKALQKHFSELLLGENNYTQRFTDKYFKPEKEGNEQQ